VGALARLTLLAHGGFGGLVVEITVVVGLAALVVAVIVQGRREARKNEEAADRPPLSGEGDVE
jgi:hypothetical protein